MDFGINQKRKIIFLTKTDKKFFLDSCVDIILSPEFYWIKKVHLPVTTLSKAKSLASSIMDGQIPDDGNFSFDVLNTDNKSEFIIIAYDKEDIIQMLKERFSSSRNIHTLYWAQTFFDDLTKCIYIDKHHSLTTIDGIVVLVPAQCNATNHILKKYAQNKKIVKNGFRISKFTSYVLPQTFSKPILILSVIFMLLQLTDIIRYYYQVRQIKSKLEILQKKYKLPKTSFQLKSIQKKFFKIYQKQKKIRELMHILERLPLEDSSYIKSMSLKDKEMTLVLSVNSNDEQKKINSYLNKFAKVKSDSFKNKIYKVTFTDE